MGHVCSRSAAVILREYDWIPVKQFSNKSTPRKIKLRRVKSKWCHATFCSCTTFKPHNLNQSDLYNLRETNLRWCPERPTLRRNNVFHVCPGKQYSRVVSVCSSKKWSAWSIYMTIFENKTSSFIWTFTTLCCNKTCSAYHIGQWSYLAPLQTVWSSENTIVSFSIYTDCNFLPIYSKRNTNFNLINWLAIAPNKVYRTSNIATRKIVTPSGIPQCVLQA